MSYKELGQEIGELVESKQRAYGDSAGKAGAIMNILYPGGIRAHQMGDALLVVRMLDKLCRIAQRGPDGKDLGGESPWRDCSGYGLLGWQKDAKAEREAAAERERLKQQVLGEGYKKVELAQELHDIITEKLLDEATAT
jgi:hypothetical protein